MYFSIVFLLVCLINLPVTEQQSHGLLDDSFETFRSSALKLQENLNTYGLYTETQERIADNDAKLAKTIIQNLHDKMEMLLDLKKLIIKDQYIQAIPSLSPITRCCEIKTPDPSSVHPGKVNENEWCIDGNILNEQNTELSFLSTSVLEGFQEIYKTLKHELKWIYYGSEEGILFNLPGYHSCERYDPRLRPWYVEASAPKPKDIIILIDSSGSMTFDDIQTAQESAITVINTLNTNDRASVVYFNEEAIVPEPQKDTCHDMLLTLTPNNKIHLRSFIGKGVAKGETSYEKAFSKAFEIFNKSAVSSAEYRDMAILLLTDVSDAAEDTSGLYQVICSGNEALSNEVVIFTYLLGKEQGNAREFLTNISRQNFCPNRTEEVREGIYTLIEESENLRYQMGKFYDLFKDNTVSDDVLFPTPYLDSYGTGMQVPMCVQIHRNSELNGVLCMDIPPESYFDGVKTYSQDQDSYAFVIDEEFAVMLHPLLSPPEQISDDSVRVPISSLEVPELRQHQNTISSTVKGEREMYSRAIFSAGNVTYEGTRVEKQNYLYRWYAVNDTDYILFTVNPITKHHLYNFTWNGRYPTEAHYHKSSSQEPLCDVVHGKIVTGESRFILTREAFTQDKEYRRIDINIDKIIAQFLRNALPDELLKPGVIETFASTTYFDDIAKSILQSGLIYVQFVTLVGVHKVYPGIELPRGYNPLKESWFERCVNEEDLTIGLLVEKPLGYDTPGISICSKLYYSSKSRDKKLYGVLNMVVSEEHFWKIISDYVPECNELTGCFIINNAGLVIMHSEWTKPWFNDNKYGAIHITSLEPDIAQDLLLNDKFKDITCIEPDIIEVPRIQKAWRQAFADHEASYWKGDNYEISRIKDTNAFIVQKYATPASPSSACRCNSIKICDECECPCYQTDIDDYDICFGNLTLFDDSPKPCTPKAITYSFVDISQQQRTLPDRTEKSKENNTAVIVGVVVACVVVILAVAVVLFCCWRRRKQKEGSGSKDIYQDYLGVIPYGTDTTDNASIQYNAGLNNFAATSSSDELSGSTDKLRPEVLNLTKDASQGTNIPPPTPCFLLVDTDKKMADSLNNTYFTYGSQQALKEVPKPENEAPVVFYTPNELFHQNYAVNNNETQLNGRGTTLEGPVERNTSLGTNYGNAQIMHTGPVEGSVSFCTNDSQSQNIRAGSSISLDRNDGQSENI